MRDIENFSAGIRNEIVFAGPGFVPIRRRDVGYFEFEGGIRDDSSKRGASLYLSRQDLGLAKKQ